MSQPQTTDVSPGVDIGARLTRGAIAGLVGGFAFILANMWFAVSTGKPGVGPLLAISTIFHASDKPVMDPQEVLIGLTLHIALSLAFGLGFGLLSVALRSAVTVVIGALVYGLLLYVVNFQIFGRTVFPFFTNPMGPNQLFELIIHPVVFGLFLVPFFLGLHASRTR